VIGQRKVVHDIRLREGEVNLLGGLVDREQTKSISGLPGLSKIPLLGRLFSTENITTTDSELMIALVPHIVRTPDLDDLSYKGIASGNMNTVRLSYAQAAAPAPAAAPPVVISTPAAPQPETPAPAARVMLSPEKLETAVGGAFNVNLQVENVSDLFAAPLRIKFDPNVLHLSDAARGNFLSGDGREILFTRNILNDTGEASMNLSRPPGSVGVSGSGSLVTLTFQVIGKGITTISVPQLRLQNSRFETILTASPQATVSVR
jgi:general secretion pathway protein D